MKTDRKPINQICMMCGSCCKAPVIVQSREEMQRVYWEVFKSNEWASDPIEYTQDFKFIMRYWKPISHGEAIKRNPILETWNLGDDHFTYICTLFKNNKCTLHEDRPRTCKEFPFYGKKRIYSKNYNLDCSYMVGLKNQKVSLNPYFSGVVIKKDMLREYNISR